MKIGTLTLDARLNFLIANTERIYLCTEDPGTDFDDMLDCAIGYKIGPTLESPDDDDDGRSIRIAPVTNGVVLADGIATHFALAKNSVSEVLLSEELADEMTVVYGSPWISEEGFIVDPES